MLRPLRPQHAIPQVACRRRGITLVELMVSMVILVVLSTLILNGLLVARQSGRVASTRSTIRKISEVILPYYEEYQVRRPRLPPSVSTITSRSDLLQIRQIALRRMIAMELPDRQSDVEDLFVNPYPPNLSALTVRPLNPSSNGSTYPLDEVSPSARRFRGILHAAVTNGADVTSAEMLYLIITRGAVADPDIVAHFRENESADTDQDGLREFVDAWGKPIMFKRWPAGFDSVLQPIDGSLNSVDESLSLYGHRLVPLIYSAGPDGSYDIEAMGDLRYASFFYNPFEIDLSAPYSPTRSPIVATGSDNSAERRLGEVVLVPVTRNGPTTFVAARLSAGGVFADPSLEQGCIAQTNIPFFTVGSERDTGSADDAVPNDFVESQDNIHNHDMRR